MLASVIAHDASIKLRSPSHVCAVYALMLNGAPVWVGSSKNVFARLGSHHKKSFDEVLLFWTTPQAMLLEEARVIGGLNPSLNINQMALRCAEANREINWETTRDVDIGRTIGCTREYARQLRSKLGKPVCENHHQSKKFLNFRSQLNGATSIKWSECGRFNEPIQNVRPWCKKLSIAFTNDTRLQNKYPWHLVNWSVRNKVIAENLGIGSLAGQRTVASMRHRLGKGRSTIK